MGVCILTAPPENHLTASNKAKNMHTLRQAVLRGVVPLRNLPSCAPRGRPEDFNGSIACNRRNPEWPKSPPLGEPDHDTGTHAVGYNVPVKKKGRSIRTHTERTQSHRVEAEKPSFRRTQGVWCYSCKIITLNNPSLFLWILTHMFVMIQGNFWKKTHQTDDGGHL